MKQTQLYTFLLLFLLAGCQWNLDKVALDCDLVNCANGICNDSTGECECEDGWTGVSCESPSNLEFVDVLGGTFQMGCTPEQPSCGSNESPVHSVTISGFKLSKYEITNEQYATFMNAIGVSSDGYYDEKEYIAVSSSFCKIDYVDGEFVAQVSRVNHPVVEVSWFGASAYCEWAVGRLPTEAEWEYAARGGNLSENYIYSGSDNPYDIAWYSSNSGSNTQEVGAKNANELGLHDMSGNVWEWCSDWYDFGYYAASSNINPQGNLSGTLRVIRGGCWSNDANVLRVSSRRSQNPTYSSAYSGFRCAKDF